MSVGGGQMQGNVIAHVRGIHTSAALQQSLHELRMPLLGNPMQRTKAVIIAAKTNVQGESERKSKSESGKGRA